MHMLSKTEKFYLSKTRKMAQAKWFVQVARNNNILINHLSKYVQQSRLKEFFYGQAKNLCLNGVLAWLTNQLSQVRNLSGF